MNDFEVNLHVPCDIAKVAVMLAAYHQLSLHDFIVNLIEDECINILDVVEYPYTRKSDIADCSLDRAADLVSRIEAETQP